MQGWGVLCRLGWIMQGCSGSCRGGVGYVGVGCVMQGWSGVTSE